MSNYANSLYRDYERLEIKNSNLSKENKFLLLRATIAEDEQRRLENIVIKKNQENNALKELNNNLKTENEKLKKELERLKSIQSLDGTNAGIPTSQTPINKKKVIPNFAIIFY